jgi:predicted nucleic acid-binding Zn finger protein
MRTSRMTIESKEELSSRFARYSGDKSQFEKAVEAALGGCVKRHVFLPSGRHIYTVVGSNADEFIDPEKSFCSCESHFYGVLGAKVKHCYHILSYKIADESQLVREVRFDDEEYDQFMRLLASDVLRSRELGNVRSHGRDLIPRPAAYKAAALPG